MRLAILCAVGTSLAAAPAFSYIEAMYPLQQFMNESEVIAEGVIEKTDPKTKTCIARITRSLKGKCAYEKVRMNIGVGQDWHPESVMKHLVEGAPVLVFYNAARQGEIYVNRFFCQLYGDAAAPPDKAWWNFTHIEIRCNRTYFGTVEDFSKLLAKILAGKEKAPAPDPKIPTITKEHIAALPVWSPKAVKEADLPVSFRKYVPPDPKTVEKKTWATDGEGFIRGWAVLGPIPVGDAGSNQTEAGQKGLFDRDWYAGQKTARPKAFEKVKIDGAEYVWDCQEAGDFFVNFGETPNTLCFALAYVLSEGDVAEAWLLTGSDDSAAWWLNGREVQRFYGGRGVVKDNDRTAQPVTLKKGMNVLLAAVINGGGPTGACARFVDKDNQPVKGLATAVNPGATASVDKK
jgi:hypothetical protein